MPKILLVEDDNNLREIYEARLQAEGYTITSAKDGEEALVVAKAEKPDLVISDVMMPKISGFEMLDILRNTDELKGVKVIMLTALGQSDDQQRADKLGADRYLVKSQVTLEDIVKVAHELLDGEGAAAPPVGDTTPVAAAEPATPEPAAAPAEPPKPEPAAEEKADVKPEPDVAVSKEEAKPAAEEEAEVDAKIEDFVAGATSEPTTPGTTADTAPEASKTAQSDDKLMADAVEKLVASTDDKKEGTAEEPAGSAAPSAPAASPTVIPVSVADDKPSDGATATDKAEEKPDEPETVGGNKIIKPLDSAEPKKDINQLLAEEEAKEKQQETAEDRPAGAAPGSTTAPTEKGVDPDSIAL